MKSPPLSASPRLLAVLLAACGTATPPMTRAPNEVLDGGPDRDAGDLADGGQDHDAGRLPVDRGPSLIPIDGDPNGLFLLTDGSLLIADDDGNRILRYRDGAGVSLVGNLPMAPDQGPGLGQVIARPDGTIVVPRFGFGTQGDVAVLAPDGTPFTVPGLDRTRRRIGMAVGPGDLLYGTYFVNQAGTRVGAVVALELTGREVEVVGGFQKPVGVLVVGDTLYVADQDQRRIFKAPLSSPTAMTVHATPDSADLLSAGPDGSLYTGGRDGKVYQIAASGAVTVFQAGLQEVRGTAYDPVHRRLFVVDHDGDATDGENHYLRVFPVDP